MSDLQIMLIVIGALIIVAVIIVNWWQERRFHQQVERSFSPLVSDALLDNTTIDDPKLDVSKFYISNSYTSIDDSEMDDFTFDSTKPAHTFHDEINAIEDAFLEDKALQSVASDRFVKLEQHDSPANNLAESVSIDAANSQLSNAISNGLSARSLDTNINETKSNRYFESSTEVKPAQHDDIKAIFDEAFSQTNKAATAFEQTSSVESSFKPTKLEAVANVLQINPEQALNQNSLQLDIETPVLSLPAMLHRQMDLTALLYLAAETSAGALNDALTGLLDDYDKPIFVHALTSNLTSNKQWYLLKDVSLNQQVSRVACSLQLADRAGAVSRNMLNSFQLAVETLGLDINAHVEWQSAGDALTTATALDTFCIEVDKTMGFHLVHGENGAFTGTKLRGLAEAQGFTLASDGTFKYFDEAAKQSINNQKAQLSFVMFNRDDNPFNPEMLRSSVVKGVTFQLDIPHVKQCAEAFTQMVQVAKQMEVGLNALLVDDNSKILSDIQIEKIRHQLKVIHATMLVRGIIPGSDSALRLFS